jgi:Fe-S oxidoreductase
MDFAGAGAKIVVTSCPGCYSALDAYTDLKEEHGIEIQHISQFLSERMDHLDTGHVDGLGRVTYHDPCDLGREKGVFDEPRRLVEAALGAPICEMAWSGMDAACCGAGSGVKSGFPELALAMARQRIAQAVSAGADTVVTACPWCVQNLRECQGGEPDVNVIDLVELMSRSIDAASQRRS